LKAARHLLEIFLRKACQIVMVNILPAANQAVIAHPLVGIRKRK